MFGKSTQNRIVLSIFALLMVLSLCGCETIAALSEVGQVKVAEEWNEPNLLPPSINTSQWEDSPSISRDGNTLYFTRGTERDVDIYVSEKTRSGWSEPKMLTELQEKTFPTGGPHSQDGEALYFSSFRPGGVGEGDIYLATREGEQWGSPQNLGAPINSEKMDAEPFISLDGKTMYFASNREGNTDIYVSNKKNDGTWSVPEKLGPPINTDVDETQPFLTEDGNDLYFMAVNREGVPGPAIFRSRKRGDVWSRPEVMVSGLVGEPTLTSDKRYLYFVHIIMEAGQLKDGEIMFVEHKQR